MHFLTIQNACPAPAQKSYESHVIKRIVRILTLSDYEISDYEVNTFYLCHILCCIREYSIINVCEFDNGCFVLPHSIQNHPCSYKQCQAEGYSYFPSQNHLTCQAKSESSMQRRKSQHVDGRQNPDCLSYIFI